MLLRECARTKQKFNKHPGARDQTSGCSLGNHGDDKDNGDDDDDYDGGR